MDQTEPLASPSLTDVGIGNDAAFAPNAAKMLQENLPDVAICTFHHCYQQLVKGETGYIPAAWPGPWSRSTTMGSCRAMS